jgi:hypothetical protein
MFLEHLIRQILKRRYAQGWSFAWSTSSTAYFKNFQARVRSNFEKKRSERAVVHGGLVPSKISGVGTNFGLLVHVLPGPNKQRAFEQSMLLS